MSLIDSPKNLIEFLEKNSIKSILIGNGYCLSHPELGEAFTWNINDAIDGESKMQDYFPIQNTDCPEKDLNCIRRNIVKKMIKYYVKNLCKNEGVALKAALDCYNKNPWKPIALFRYFENNVINIYTLNYDPFLYFELLKLQNRFDGFVTNGDDGRDGCLRSWCKGNNELEFKKQQYYSCKLDRVAGKCKIYYLHGAWFILENNLDELKKISVQHKINVDDLFSEEKRPFFILEDRWYVKDKLIEINPYWKYCVEKLKKTHENILVFGVSFDNDEHILKYLDDSSFNKIYICYLTDDDRDRIRNKFTQKELQIKHLNEKVDFVQVHNNIIWQKNEL